MHDVGRQEFLHVRQRQPQRLRGRAGRDQVECAVQRAEMTGQIDRATRLQSTPPLITSVEVCPYRSTRWSLVRSQAPSHPPQTASICVPRATDCHHDMITQFSRCGAVLLQEFR